MKPIGCEQIVLVDDVRTNFQSPFSKQSRLLRYCKVARYDGSHPQMGFVPDMGGLGAQSVSDYMVLKKFVNRPWDYRAASALECMERDYETSSDRALVSLVVFEFDETLSLCTFVNEEERFATQVGFAVSPAEKEHLLLYNYESPYITGGNRLKKLDALLEDLASKRVLAILTENSAGAVAVLNLLMMADIDKHFSAIWAPSAENAMPSAVHKAGGRWTKFRCPAGRVESKAHRAELLHSIVDEPDKWFPQLGMNDPGDNLSLLRDLHPEQIVAVDDERTNFIPCTSMASGETTEELTEEMLARTTAQRYCRVARYDDEYRDQGFIIHMGGVGAKSDDDFTTLTDFVERPWRYRVVQPDFTPSALLMSTAMSFSDGDQLAEAGCKLVRRSTEERVEKTPVARRRLTNSMSLHTDGQSASTPRD